MTSPPAPHRIRLRGPWEYQPLWRHRLSETEDALPPPGRLQLPADWSQALGAGFSGRVRFLRRFGRPGTLDSHEQVWLVCEGVADRADLWLNDHPLGEIAVPDQRAEFEITAQLQVNNLLRVEVESTSEGPSPAGLIGEVRLEIRTLA